MWFIEILWLLSGQSGDVTPRNDRAASGEESEEDPDVEAAVRELVPDLAHDEDEAHLDLTLEEESAVISEYKALLLSTGWYSSSASGT